MNKRQRFVGGQRGNGREIQQHEGEGKAKGSAGSEFPQTPPPDTVTAGFQLQKEGNEPKMTHLTQQ